MKYSVVLLDQATRDVYAIMDWLMERSPLGASRWMAALEDALIRLASHPDSFAHAPESPFVSYELRQFLFRTPPGRTYRGIFTVIDHEVRVLRVRGPGQPPLRPDELP